MKGNHETIGILMKSDMKSNEIIIKLLLGFAATKLSNFKMVLSQQKCRRGFKKD